MARRKKRKFNLSEHIPEVESSVKRGIFIVLIFLLAVLSLLSIFDLAGTFGRYFYQILKLLFGWGFWIFPIVLATTGYLSLKNTRHSFKDVSWLGMFLLIIGYSGFLHLIQKPEIFKEILKQGAGGGYIGFAIAMPLFKLMGRWAAMAVTFTLFLIGLMLMFNQSIEDMFAKFSMSNIKEKTNGFWNKPGDTNDEEEQNEEDGEEEYDEEVTFEEKTVGDIKDEIDADEVQLDNPDDNQALVVEKKEKVHKKYKKIEIPLSLLNNKAGKPAPEDINKCKSIIEKTLANFGIQVEMGDYAVGPTVTQYTFRPVDGVKLSRIIGLGNNLALALAAQTIRIEAPIPGKSLVGIEVPNKKNAVVPLRQVLESKAFKERGSNLTLVLGQDVAGQPWIVDLAKLPHLLVAGQTGSGKTVCLNSIIIALLYQNQPDELKFILVDPKRVDMPVYNGMPYLLTPVITEPKKIINALKWTITEMNRRFTILNSVGKKNIHSYNVTHPKDKLPYIIFVIDELAQLMGIIGAELEAGVVSLAQMGRAAGIHLILATQRPSVNIITGIIKANISGRIAFSVASLMDSRTILDVSGAEKLVGKGDLLFSSDQTPKPKRIQGAYCSDKDIEDVVGYLKENTITDYDETVIDNPNSLGLGGLITNKSVGVNEAEDELLEEARILVIKAGKASASYLQRRLKIGYVRAARILDFLEEKGVVGPVDGAKSREILVKLGEESLVEQADNILKQNNVQVGTNIDRIQMDNNKMENNIEDLADDKAIIDEANSTVVEYDEGEKTDDKEVCEDSNEVEVNGKYQEKDETIDKGDENERDEDDEEKEDKYNF